MIVNIVKSWKSSAQLKNKVGVFFLDYSTFFSPTHHLGKMISTHAQNLFAPCFFS